MSGAWHRAVVADRPDEGLAGELEARGRRRRSAAARTPPRRSTFERAADLSEDAGARGRRLRGAAQASLDAGRLDAALALVERARPLDLRPGRGGAARPHPRHGGRAPRLARRRLARCCARRPDAVADAAPELATELALWSLFTGLQGGWDERVFAEDATRPRAHRLGRRRSGASRDDAGRRRCPRYFAGDAATAGDTLRRGARDRGEPGRPADGGHAGLRVGDHRRLAARARALHARGRAGCAPRAPCAGLVGVLPLLAFTELAERRMREAQASVAEGLELARALGYENDETGLLGVQARIAALHGDARRAAARTRRQALRRSVRNGIGWATTNARLALAELELGPRQPARGDRPLRADRPHAGRRPSSMMARPGPDRRGGARRRARARRGGAGALRRVGADQPRAASCTGCSRAAARCSPRATRPRRLFQEALELHARETPPYERARTQLAYGERLRRERRKIEARAQLRSALETFEGVGADLWAQRARGELNATGESARKRDASTIDDLTPAGAAHRPARGRRGQQPRRRRAALREPEDRRVPPAQGLPEARRCRRASSWPASSSPGRTRVRTRDPPESIAAAPPRSSRASREAPRTPKPQGVKRDGDVSLSTWRLGLPPPQDGAAGVDRGPRPRGRERCGVQRPDQQQVLGARHRVPAGSGPARAEVPRRRRRQRAHGLRRARGREAHRQGEQGRRRGVARAGQAGRRASRRSSTPTRPTRSPRTGGSPTPT